MSKHTLSEMLKIERSTAAEMKHLLDTHNIDPEDVSPEVLEDIEDRARDRAEAAFDNWVDQGIDERKERKAFGEDR